jgi:tRNA threonylcarbamoyladenosine biosynthesis protein TsaE
MIIKSLDHLNSISKKISNKILNSDLILLYGEVGTGKTTFARSLINYLQIKEDIKITDVLSPTYNLVYEYELKSMKIMHYDLYRLKNKTEIQQLGIFDNDQLTVKIIEWPELINKNIIDKIELKFEYAINEHERNLSLKGYGKWAELNINEI